MVWVEFLGKAGTAILGAAAIPLIFALMRRAQRRAERDGDPMVMTYPSAVAWMGIAVIVMFLGIALLILFADEAWTTQGFVGLMGLLGFGLAGLYLLAEGSLVQHRIAMEGLLHRSLFRAPRLIRWKAIRSVRFSQINRWYVLRAGDTTARISAAMTSQVLFADAVLRRASRAEIDPVTRDVLWRAAAGDPPRGFG